MDRLGVFVAVLGGFLAMWVPLGSAYVTPKVLALSIGSLMIWAASKGPFMWPVAGAPVLALLAWAFLNANMGIDPGLSLIGPYRAPFHSTLTMTTAALLYFGAGSNRHLMKACMIAAGVMSIYAIAQALGFDFAPWPLQNGRTGSTLGSPVYLGACYVLLIPVVIHESITTGQRLPFLVLCLSTAALVTTRSKGAILSVAAGMMAYGYISGEIKRRYLVLASAVAIAFGALFAGRGLSASDSMRIETAKTAIRAFVEKPLTGSGPDTFLLTMRRLRTNRFISLNHNTRIVQASAHNDILQVMATMGLLGLTGYLWLIWTMTEAIWKERNAMLAAVMVGLFLQAKINPLPIPVLAIAAMLFASLGGKPALRSYPGAGIVLSLLLVLACSAITAADYHYGKAVAVFKDPVQAVEPLRKAVLFNPIEPEYRYRLAECLMHVAARKDINALEEAFRISHRGVQLHPLDPLGWEIQGNVLMLGVSLIGIRFAAPAMRSLDRAQSLDPKSKRLLKARRWLAKITGDNRLPEIEARLKLVSGLERF